MSSSLVVSSVCRSVLYGATGAASPWSCGRMRCERKCSSPDDEALSAPSSSSSLAIKYNAMCCSAPAHIRRHRRAWSPAIFDVHHVKLCAFRCVGSGKPINADVDASISSRTPTPASSSSSSSSSNSILAEMLKRRTASAIIPEWVSHAKARRQPSNTANLGRPQHPSPMPTTASTWMSSGPPITTEIQPHKKHEEKLVRGKERGATRRTSSSSSHLILDPVAWLSQEANAPLVEDLDAILPAHNNNTNDMQNSSTNNSSNVEDEDIFDDVDARTTTTPRRASTKTTSGRRDAANTNTNTTSSSSSSCLVLNPFTGRVGAPTSPQIRSLALLGIGVNEDQRELVVKDRDALRHFSRQLQQQHMRWPIFWNRGRLYRQLREVLADASVEDVAASVAALLQHEYRSLRERRRHAAGVVSSNNNNVDEVRGGSSISSAVEDADARVDAPLNDEQRHVIEFVLEGYNTFIGGSAGTGKSVLLRALRRRLVREGLQVAMTATTGIAGSQLGGTTLHHCLGINLHGDFTRRRELTAYDVIIIDEVSMLPRDVFESMEMHLRHAHGVELPFGGVQIVVCGDFLQLGAIHAQSIISSPIFRRHFAMLKLHSVMRQSESPVYAAQLQQLRMGKLPHNLHETIEFLTAQDVVRERQRLAKVHQQQAQVLRQLTTTPSSSSSSSSSSSHAHEAKEEEVKAATGATPSSPDIAIIDGAVNLLPTNREVDATNARELARLDGDAVTFPAQILAPSLSGSWSSTYILRIPKPDAHQHRRLCHCVNAFISGFAQHLQRDDGAATAAARTAMASHSISAASALTWLRNLSTHPDNVQHQVPLYRIFSDGLALRVRLPPTLPSPTTPGRGCGGDDGERVVIAAFLRYLDGLDAHLEQHAEEIGGIRVREVLTQADGLHTERDEEILMHHIQRSTLAQDLTLKIGARVMLRSNFAPGLVNGSLGTVVGFRRLSVELLSPYLANSATRATAIESYANFLRIEHGFETAMVPEIDFGGGRVEVIPPITHTVGGCANTHFYSLGSVSLPLTLAYAFTVHKVQGLTLVGRVHLELSRMWPCEHLLYVAMSRVRNPEQLSLANFRAELLRVSSDHLLFDLSIPTVEHVRRCAHFIQATWRRCPERRKRQLHQRKVATLRASEKAKKARADRKQVAAIIEEMQEQLSASRGGEISASRE